MCCDNTAADEFGDAVIAYTRQFFPGADVDWFGDPAGAKRSETDAKTVFGILAEKGIYVSPGEITLTSRLDSVKKRLRMRGGILISPSCVRLVTGFSGSYCYKRVGNTDYYGDKPEKNKWSHIHDALQYIASVVFYGSGYEEADDFVMKISKTRKAMDSRVGY
jgi:hypothetical protein